MTADEIIAVVSAFKEGKQIESRYRHGGSWATVEKPAWDFDQNDYRVKPEPPKPREWLAQLTDSRFGFYGWLFRSDAEAKEQGCQGPYIRVHEVLE